MNTINAICTLFGDILLWPFMIPGLSTGLVLFSMFAGLLIILVLPSISNQTGIKWAKDRIKGHLLEVYLYRNNVGIAMKAQLNMLRYNMAYVFFALTPVVVLMIPFVLIMIQLNARFGYEPLQVGDSANVKVLFNETLPEKEITLTPSDGIKIETPPCRVPHNGEVLWRIRALKEGIHSVTLRVGDTEIKKEIVVGMDRVITPVRYRSALSQIFYPGEPALSQHRQVRSIECNYSPRTLTALGIRSNWLVVFLVVTILFAFLIKGWFHVEI